MLRVAYIKNKNILLKNEISEIEFNALKENLKPLGNINHEYNFINDLKSDFEDLDSFLNKYISGNETSQNFERNLNKHILSYLSLVRSFLDKWEKNIKEYFGKESSEVENFEKITHKEYDENFHYRFMYYLRDYAIHTGFAIHQVSERLDSNNKLILELLIDKKLFINEFGWKGSFKDEIGLLPEDKINIMPYLHKMYLSLEKIHSSLVEFNIINNMQKLLYCSLFFINFLNKYNNEQGEIIIMKDSNKIIYWPCKDIGIASFILKTHFNAIKEYFKIYHFSGKYLGGVDNSFPKKKHNGFFEGSENVTHDNVNWTRLINEHKPINNQEEIFSIYSIAGYPHNFYKLNLKIIMTVKKSRLTDLLDLFNIQ